ncbi:MAG: methyltransferase domain-containing protein, partial [Acidimicrobiales bacterium]
MSEAPAAGTGSSCAVCQRPFAQPFLSLSGLPVLCNASWPTREEARLAPRGDIALAFCPACGMIANTAFDEHLVTYTPAYENSLHFSPSFQHFATELAARLATTYGLAGGSVLEIGCGKGEFLSLLCDTAGCSGTGYDPTFEGTTPEGAPYTVEPNLFPSAPDDLRTDLVVCRQVLEHLDDPRAVLRTLRTALGPSSTTPAYLEVPDGHYMFAAPALWDVIYEHPWYYSAPSLEFLLEVTGFEVIGTRSTFGGQYLSAEARPAPMARTDLGSRAEPVAMVVEAAATFGRRFREAVDRWSGELAERAAGGDVVVLWGAGSKGATFLNVVP